MCSSRVNIHALGVSHKDPVNCKLVSEVIQMAQLDLIALEASYIMKLLFGGCPASVTRHLIPLLQKLATSSFKALAQHPAVLSAVNIQLWNRTVAEAFDQIAFDFQGGLQGSALPYSELVTAYHCAALWGFLSSV